MKRSITMALALAALSASAQAQGDAGGFGFFDQLAGSYFGECNRGECSAFAVGYDPATGNLIVAQRYNSTNKVTYTLVRDSDGSVTATKDPYGSEIYRDLPVSIGPDGSVRIELANRYEDLFLPTSQGFRRQMIRVTKDGARKVLWTSEVGHPPDDQKFVKRLAGLVEHHPWAAAAVPAGAQRPAFAVNAPSAGAGSQPASTPIPAVPAALEAFGVLGRMVGRTWHYPQANDEVLYNYFVTVERDETSGGLRYGTRWDGEDQSTVVDTLNPIEGGRLRTNAGHISNVRPDGSLAFPTAVNGDKQYRRVLRMIDGNTVEYYFEEAKARKSRPKWTRVQSNSFTARAIGEETVARMLFEGPARIAKAREALIPKHWGFLAELPGRTDIAQASNVYQRATLTLNIARDPGMLILRTAEWEKRGEQLRIDYVGGNGARWSERLTRTGPGTFKVAHSGPTGAKSYTAKLIKDSYGSVSLKMDLGSMPCGRATRSLSKSETAGTVNYSDFWTAICKHNGMAPEPTSDYGSWAAFWAYAPELRKTMEAGLAGWDRSYAQNDADDERSRREWAAYDREWAREHAAIEARNRAGAAERWMGILSGSTVRGEQARMDGLRRTGEQAIAAGVAQGTVGRAAATGRPMEGNAFNQAIEQALSGTGIRRDVIEQTKARLGSTSSAAAGSRNPAAQGTGAGATQSSPSDAASNARTTPGTGGQGGSASANGSGGQAQARRTRTENVRFDSKWRLTEADARQIVARDLELGGYKATGPIVCRSAKEWTVTTTPRDGFICEGPGTRELVVGEAATGNAR